MAKNVFYADAVIAPDGIITVTSEDIRGLVLEADKGQELDDELIRVAGRLLQSNHGLTDEEIDDSVIILRSRLLQDQEAKRRRRTVAGSAVAHAPALAYA